MNFKDNKAIYLQIADRIGDQILSGALTPDGKVPSVRELAAEIEVNANTVARTYDHLQQNGVIFTKRGLGYFVSPEAKEKIARWTTSWDSLRPWASPPPSFRNSTRIISVSKQQKKQLRITRIGLTS